MSFWSTATTEQRLAQIDGGIECGMTSKQIAMCLGAPIYGDGHSNRVLVFAQYHGRHFPTSKVTVGRRYGKVGGRIGGLVTARKRGRPEIQADGAFEIFPQDHEETPFAFLTEETDR